MRKPMSAGLCLEILSFVLGRERVRVVEIQKEFNLSYRQTHKIIADLEAIEIIGSFRPGPRIVLPRSDRQGERPEDQGETPRNLPGKINFN